MRIIELLVPYFLSIILIGITVAALCQRDAARAGCRDAKHIIEQHELVIDSLTTMCNLQEDIYKVLEKENIGIAEDIDRQNEVLACLKVEYAEYKRWSKVHHDALEGRIAKLAGAYQSREMRLLAEIKRLEKQLELCVKPVKPQLPPLEVDENGKLIRPKMSPGFPVGKGKHGGWVHPPSCQSIEEHEDLLISQPPMSCR